MENLRYYLPGIILILLAILVIAVPEILLAFVAATIIMAGIGVLYIGHMFRKAEIELSRNNTEFEDHNLFGFLFDRRPFSRRWYR